MLRKEGQAADAAEIAFSTSEEDISGHLPMSLPVDGSQKTVLAMCQTQSGQLGFTVNLERLPRLSTNELAIDIALLNQERLVLELQ